MHGFHALVIPVLRRLQAEPQRKLGSKKRFVSPTDPVLAGKCRPRDNLAAYRAHEGCSRARRPRLCGRLIGSRRKWSLRHRAPTPRWRVFVDKWTSGSRLRTPGAKNRVDAFAMPLSSLLRVYLSVVAPALFHWGARKKSLRGRSCNQSISPLEEARS